MPKSISTALKAHLAQTVTTMTACWLVVRLDGAMFGFTTLDMDLTVDGQLYKSTTGFSRTAMSSGVTGEVDNLDVLGYFASTGIVAEDLNNGKFNYASVYLFAVNWADLTMGICRLRRGYLGETVSSPNGQFQAELRGLTQALVQEFNNYFSPLCRADLGDPQCKVNLAPLTLTATVTGVTAQNQFTTTALQYPGSDLGNIAQISFVAAVTAGSAIEISDGVHTVSVTFPFDTSQTLAFSTVLGALPGSLDVTVTTSFLNINLHNHSGQQGVIQKSGDIIPGMIITNFAENYLDGGTVTWLTGLNAGISMELKTYVPTGQQVVLWLSMSYAIQIGDTFSYFPGCDKTRQTCTLKFNNILNFRGEPDIPGMDMMLNYPDTDYS